MLQRLRKAADEGTALFSGPVEVDEMFFGGERKNMHASKRRKLKGRGTVGKTAVAGIKDRKTKKVVAKVVPNTKATTLQPLIWQHVRPGAKVYTDDFPSYRGIQGFEHDSVKHSVGRVHEGHRRPHQRGRELLVDVRAGFHRHLP